MKEKLDSYTLNKELHIESFLKKREVEIYDLDGLSNKWENHFLRVHDLTDEELAGYLKEESFYIEGCLCIWSYGREILSFGEWDLVDQLWAYFIDALHQVIVCGEAEKEFDFPDQPLPILIEKHKRDLKLTINTDKTYVLPQKTFCTIFSTNGIQFLKRLAKACNTSKYSEFIQMAEEIIEHVNR